MAAALLLAATGAHAGSERVWRPDEEPTPATSADPGPQHARFTKLRDHRYSERFAVERVALAADGSEVVALTRASREGPRSWDVRSGQARKLPPMSRDASAIGWAPGKDLLAVSIRADVLSGETPGVELVRMSDGSRAGFLERGDAASALAFSPEGTQLAAASGEGVLLWALPGARPSLILELGAGAEAVSWVSPSELMVSADGGARLMRISTGGAVLESWNGKRADGPVSFSPTGQLVAVGEVNSFKILDLWDGGGAQQVAITGTVNSLAWSSDGRTLAAGTDEGLVHVYAVEGVRGIEFSTAPAATSRTSSRGAPPREERAPERNPREESDPYDLRGAADPLDRGGNQGLSSGGGGGGNPFAGTEVSADLAVLVLDQMGGDPRTGTTIEAALTKNIKRLEPCWKKQARAGKLSAGKLILEFGVTPNGEGVAVQVPLQDDVGNPKLVECLGERLREPLFGSGLGSLQIELTIDLSLR